MNRVLKKLSVATLATFFAIFAIIGLGTLTTYADTASSTASQASDFSGGGSLLGLPHWYDGGANVFAKDSNPIDGVLKIGANVISIAFYLIGMLSVIFIIIGGFQYMISAGEASRVTKGKDTLTRAIIGLAIGLVGNAVVNYIANNTFGGSFISTTGKSSSVGIPEWGVSTLSDILNIAYFVAGALAVIMIVYSGIQFVISSGDPGKATKARQTLLYSVVGLAVVLLAYAITNYITSISGIGGNDFKVIIKSITSTAFYVVGVLAIVMIVYSGIRMVASNGNASQVTKARQTLTYSIVGLAVALLAYGIINFVVSSVK